MVLTILGIIVGIILIVLFVKYILPTLLLILLWAAIIGLAGFGIYKLVRYLYDRKMELAAIKAEQERTNREVQETINTWLQGSSCFPNIKF